MVCLGRVVRDGNRIMIAAFAFFVTEEAFVANVKALSPEKTVGAITRTTLAERTQVPDLKCQNRPILIRERRCLCVRGLPVIIQTKSTARAVDSHRQTAVVPPDGFIHLMDSLVPDFTIAVFPKVMPIVMHIQTGLLTIRIDHKRMFRR